MQSLPGSGEKKEKPQEQRPSILRHDAFSALGSIASVLLVFLVVFIVLMGVSTAAIPDVSIFNLSYTHDQMKFRFWAESMTYPVVICSVLFGAAVAFASFRFLMIKMQTTTYLSLPIPRSRLYLTRVGVDAAGMFVVLLAALFVSLVLNLVALGSWNGESLQFLYILVGLFVCALVGYAIMLAAVLFSGTQVEAVLFGAALFLAVSVVCWGVNVVMDYLLVGNTAGEFLLGTQVPVGTSLLVSFSTCNPLLFFVNAAAAHQVFSIAPPVYTPQDPNWLIPLAWAVFVVAVLAACELLFVRRKGEKAGITGLCTPMTFVVSCVVGLFVFALVFYVLATVSVPSAIVAGVLVFLLVSFILLRGPLRGITTLRRSLCVLGVETVVLLAVIAVISAGGLGWSGSVPAADQVASVEVSYTGSPSYYARSYDSASTTDTSFYVSGSYEFSDGDSIALVEEAHSELAASGGLALEEGLGGFENTVLPYDVCITYTMKDGSKQSRYYDRATVSTLAKLAKLDDTETLQALRAAVVSGKQGKLDDETFAEVRNSSAAQAFSEGAIYLADGLLGNPVALNTSKTARAELLTALASDISKQSAEDRYHSKSSCRGVIMFSQDGENDAASFSYQMENSVIYLTDSFTSTLKWMKEHGAKSALKSSASELGQVAITRYDPYVNGSTTPSSQYFMAYTSTNASDFITVSDFGTRFTVNSKKKVAELAKLVKTNYYMDGGGYLVSARLKGTDKYAYYFLPYSTAPSWVKTQVVN